MSVSPTIWRSVILVLFCAVNIGASVMNAQAGPAISTWRLSLIPDDEQVSTLQADEEGETDRPLYLLDVFFSDSRASTPVLLSSWLPRPSAGTRPAAHLLEQAAYFVRAP